MIIDNAGQGSRQYNITLYTLSDQLVLLKKWHYTYLWNYIWHTPKLYSKCGRKAQKLIKALCIDSLHSKFAVFVYLWYLLSSHLSKVLSLSWQSETLCNPTCQHRMEEMNDERETTHSENICIAYKFMFLWGGGGGGNNLHGEFLSKAQLHKEMEGGILP